MTAFFLLPAALGALESVADNVEIAAPQPTQSAHSALPAALPADEITVPENTPQNVDTEPIQAPEPTPEAPRFVAMEFDMHDESVHGIQQRLMDLFYMDSDETTDYYGEVTRAAILTFQRINHMAETGIADEETQAVLFSAAAMPYKLNKGSSGEDVLTLQRELVELGYYADKVNGYYGTATGRAVSAFQKKNKLDVTGEADYSTVNLVYSPKAKPAIDPTPTPTQSPTPKPTKTPTPTKTPKPTKTPAVAATDGGAWEALNTQSPVAEPTVAPTRYEFTGNASVSDFIDMGMSYVGTRYVLGGKGPDKFDCSGFVYYCLKNLGVMKRYYNSSGMSQYEAWPAVYGKENLERGDLVFYKSDNTSSTAVTHVAVYLGGGKILHASASAGKVCTTSWGSWGDRNFLFGRRVF